MLARIRAILKRKGYQLFSRPFELNIVGLRSNQTKANRFDDEIHVFYRTDENQWKYHIFPATTDPGTFWLENPMQPQGTAILNQGQYKGAYMLGLHRGQYKALVQNGGPVTITRDYNRNSRLDFSIPNFSKGYFGINIHRAKVEGKTLSVDKYSAGCQVFQRAEDFESFLGLCEVHRERYGNSFTYSLIDFRAVKKENLRRFLLGAISTVLAITGLILYAYEDPDKKSDTGDTEKYRNAA